MWLGEQTDLREDIVCRAPAFAPPRAGEQIFVKGSQDCCHVPTQFECTEHRGMQIFVKDVHPALADPPLRGCPYIKSSSRHSTRRQSRDILTADEQVFVKTGGHRRLSLGCANTLLTRSQPLTGRLAWPVDCLSVQIFVKTLRRVRHDALTAGEHKSS